MTVRTHVAVAALALAVATFYYVYLSPQRLSSHFDQYDYEALARVIAGTGAFGRQVGDAIVPEARRTVGYPLFLAGILKVAGDTYPAAAWVQAALFATMPAALHFLSRDVLSRREALVAAIASALYLPVAHWTAYTMTETLATFLTVVGTVALYAAVRQSSWSRAAFAGACLGYAGLVRPTLSFTVVALSLAVLLAARPWPDRRRIGIVTVAVATAVCLGVVPQVAYNWTNFGRAAISPYPPGYQIVLGYWQGAWPGRLSARLTSLATERASSERVAATAREVGVDPERLARYVHENAGYGERLGTNPGGFIRANEWAFDRAVEDVRGDLAGFAWRGLTSRLPVLIAGNIPVRYEQIDALPRPVLLAMWGTQAAVVGMALLGIVVLLRRGGDHALAGAMVLALLAYVCAVHVPFWVDARYGLPVQPLLIVAAVVGISAIIARTRSLRTRRLSGRMAATGAT